MAALNSNYIINSTMNSESGHLLFSELVQDNFQCQGPVGSDVCSSRVSRHTSISAIDIVRPK